LPTVSANEAKDFLIRPTDKLELFILSPFSILQYIIPYKFTKVKPPEH